MPDRRQPVRDELLSMHASGLEDLFDSEQQGLVPASEAAPKAKAAAAKALELDGMLAEVHDTLAGIKTWTDWDWAGGEAEYRRAIELNPNLPGPRSTLSHLLHITKRPEEAMTHIRRALELDPLNALFRGFYAMDLMYAHRYDDAIAVIRETLRTSPNDLLALSTLRSAYHMKHMYPEALEAWKASYAARGDQAAGEALDRGFKEGGYPMALQRTAETLAARSRTAYVPAWQIGTLYTTRKRFPTRRCSRRSGRATIRRKVCARATMSARSTAPASTRSRPSSAKLPRRRR